MDNSRPSKKRVFVAMSGGVDSSVAAYLLKKQGYDVVGVFMRCWSGTSAGLNACSAEQDATDARRVAEKIGILFYVWDFEEEYKKKVVDYMISGYRKGITPNPDVMCNKEIKFGLFLEKALEMGADYMATGHYVRLVSRRVSDGTGYPLAPAASGSLDSRSADSRFARGQARQSSETFRTKPAEKLHSLFEGEDKSKDQSYFLWTLTQEQLKHCLFPIGDYLKSEVREIARKAGLPTAEKKDSQGICFLGKVTLGEFLKQYIPEKRGAILNVGGQKIGEHKGAHFYTIGQRHIGISKNPACAEASTGRKNQKSNSAPVYVAEKNIKNNTLIVAEGDNNPTLYKKEIELAGVNFINPITNYQLPITVYARVRYRQPLVTATLLPVTPNKIRINQQNQHKSAYRIIFDNPIKAVAPGQSAVLYSKGGEMLGGGIIR